VAAAIVGGSASTVVATVPSVRSHVGLDAAREQADTPSRGVAPAQPGAPARQRVSGKRPAPLGPLAKRRQVARKRGVGRRQARKHAIPPGLAKRGGAPQGSTKSMKKLAAAGQPALGRLKPAAPAPRRPAKGKAAPKDSGKPLAHPRNGGNGKGQRRGNAQ
jgi:hypothetical protein